MAGIDCLPGEILVEILAQVKVNSSNLFSCILVSRSWYQLGLPLLYRNVVLSDSNVSVFCGKLNASHGSLVRSLTVRIAPIEDAPATLLPGLLSTLVQLPRMTTFAFRVTRQPVPSFSLSQDQLISLVDALPESCINLEIDTNSSDVAPNADGAHFCNALRRILPRMRNVRLQLKFMCSQLFGDGPPLPGNLPSDPSLPFEPVSLPNIQTLMVDCIADNANLPKHCKHPKMARHPFTGWDSVTEALKRVVEQDGSHPPSARLFVLSSLPLNNTNQRSCTAFARAEMVSQTTYTLPFCIFAFTNQYHGWMLRTPDGREIFSTVWTLKDFAEGGVWKTIVGGSRIPAEVLLQKEKSFIPALYVEEKLPIMSLKEWTARYPDISCPLWRNELQAGVRLLDGEKREGPEEYLSRRPVTEKTPPGFVRLRSEAYINLYGQDDPRIINRT
ncbi:F-box domain containing protein [Coccidioides posadasii C735 delta SOWgp]|uniref:F-box domain-containing protein n=2 Tax=Coccidioides posadasii TaxID=199306 RepID=A0A0J6FHM2_COCPO|nr:F-box domain containing protein [Coccidioides posadasii C735 delta SOWgp]EER24751.1 F-box domain containing protein [Coccidioides posadasii C735 delta SOWgp]KMM68324.1 hypothetical protein CPAG_04653 [Coccidioides posadasii RMSCC 3488]|eukprot:XP_003066896.1 F-box domain containing protein [Coccidioides posadasii C735 delta SOWgp]